MMTLNMMMMVGVVDKSYDDDEDKKKDGKRAKIWQSNSKTSKK